MMSLSVWLPGPMFLLGGLCPGGLCRETPPRFRKAGSIHPTGMFSCFVFGDNFVNSL